MKKQSMHSTKESLSKTVLACAVLFFCLYNAARIEAQIGTTPSRGFFPANSYTFGDIETVNPINGNLMLNIPLASLPLGRGGVLDAKVKLIYNSKIWDTRAEGALDENDVPFTRYRLIGSAQGGWRYGFQYKLELFDRSTQYEGPPFPDCPNPLTVYVYKMKVIFPDGSEHEFRPQGYTESFNDGYFNISPDGALTRCNGQNIETTVVPNTLTYFSTDGSHVRLDIEHDNDPPFLNWENNPWTLYFPDGTRVTGGNANQRIYDRNNNYIEIQNIIFNGHFATRIIDQLNRSIFMDFDPTLIQGAFFDHITMRGVNNEEMEWKVKWKQIHIRKTYDGAGGTTDPVGLAADPYMADQIIFPSQAGSLNYSFGYNATSGNPSFGWGELSSLTIPTGAQTAYSYSLDGVNNVQSADFVAQSFMKRKDLTYQREYDGASSPTTETWNYLISPQVGYVECTITAPDQGVERVRAMPADGGWNGGLVFRTESPSGVVTERIWQSNIPFGVRDGFNALVDMNPYVKTEFTSLKDAGGTLVKTSIKDFNYDKNGNMTREAIYDWVPYSSVPRDGDGKPTGIPASAQVKRVNINTYYNPTPDATDNVTDDPDTYHKATSKQLRRALESTEVRSGESPTLALSRTEFFYDNAATTSNLTEQKKWDSNKGGTPRALTRPLVATNSVSVSNQYGSNGNRTFSMDARGYQTQYIYGPVNGFSDLYVTQTKQTLGTAEQRIANIEYDFYTGVMTRTTDADNNVASSFTYDVFGRPTLAKAYEGTPKESRTATIYSDANRRVITRKDLSVAGDAKLVIVQHYDQLGRLRLTRRLEDASTQAAEDETTGVKAQMRYAFSGQNSYTLVSNAYRATTSALAGSESTMGWNRVKFDQGGRTMEERHFTGASLPAPFGTNVTTTGATTITYDGIYTTVTDEAGKVRRSVADGLGRFVRVDEPDTNGSLGGVDTPAQPTNYSYDAMGNLVQVQQGAQQIRTFNMSSLSRLTSESHPESGTSAYLYDDSGNLLRRTNGSGSPTATSVDYTYDGLNRMATKTLSTGGVFVYTYDTLTTNGKGRLTSVTLQGSSDGYYIDSYDVAGRVTSCRQVTDTHSYPMAYTYDIAGNLKTETYPSGTVITTDYDAIGRLNKVSGPNNKVYAESFSYAAHGAVTEMKLGNGLWEHNTYNARLQVTAMGLGSSANSSVVSIENTFSSTNNNGDILNQAIIVGKGTGGQITMTQTFTYDSIDRLKTAGESGNAWSQTYSYDRFGNRWLSAGMVLDSQLTPQLQSNIDAANNRLTLGQTLYNAQGNQTRDAAGRILAYNAENHLTNFNSGAGAYTYDGFEKRVKKTIGASVTIFVYNVFGHLVAEYTSDNPPGGTTSYLTTDQIGSVRVVTGSGGVVKARHDFLPFGEEIPSTVGARSTIAGYGVSDGIRQKFTSQERDTESGLDYFMARYYSGAQARFTSSDPTIDSAQLGMAQTWNRYTYVLNNPLTTTDPTGQFWVRNRRTFEIKYGGHYGEPTADEAFWWNLMGWEVLSDGWTIEVESGAWGSFLKFQGKRIRLESDGRISVLGPIPQPDPPEIPNIGAEIFKAYAVTVIIGATGGILLHFLPAAGAVALPATPEALSVTGGGTAAADAAAATAAGTTAAAETAAATETAATEAAQTAGQVLKGRIANAIPQTLAQSLALEEAMNGSGGIIMRNLADVPRLIANYGEGEWVKMEWVHRAIDGTKIVIHWFRNLTSGENVEFKFKP